MGLYLGIDAGTSALKAVLFDQHGRTLASASEEYVLLCGEGDRVELDPEIYWGACVRCIGRVVLESHGYGDRVIALAISSQGETFVPVDERGRPLRDAIVWMDNRSGAEARLVGERFGASAVHQITGSPEVAATWAATKILWLRRNEARTFARAAKFLFVEDYLIHRLSGEFAADQALYCSSLLLDTRSGAWWTEMLDFLELAPTRLPPLLGSGQVVGAITAAAATETGLPPGTLVVTAGMDQACAAVGAGNIRPGMVSESTGTTLNACATVDRFRPDPRTPVPVQCHAAPGRYILLPWFTSGGLALRWFRDAFCAAELAEAQRTGRDAYSLMTEEAATVPAGSEGLVMLPHLSGGMCPEYNALARGAYFGIGLHHRRAHFIRATMEAVAFMLRTGLDLLGQLGVAARDVRSQGGAARSPLWNQIKAGVIGVPVLTLASDESACLGAAILAATATGAFNSLDEACGQMVSVAARYEPDPAVRPLYDQGYATYCRLYDTLKQAFWSGAGSAGNGV